MWSLFGAGPRELRHYSEGAPILDDDHPEALQAAREAAEMQPPQPSALQQLASLHSDSGDVGQLDAAVARLRAIAPDRPATHYFLAVLSFLRGDAAGAVGHANAAIAADPQYAPVYDLLGAAYTRLAQPERARGAFLTSLRYDAHDSTAYGNLGVLELAAGNHHGARNYFAEALWLDADSELARQGLSVALSAAR